MRTREIRDHITGIALDESGNVPHEDVTVLCPYVLTAIDAHTIVDAFRAHPQLQFEPARKQSATIFLD